MIYKETCGSLDQVVQSFYEENLAEECKKLRSAVRDNPALLGDSELNLISFRSNLKGIDYPLLALLHWYMPEELSVLVYLWLSDTKWGQPYENFKSILLNSKGLCLAWWITQEKIRNEDFFGNILRKDAPPMKRIKTLRAGPKKRKNPQRNQRRRGYSDHGTFVPSHKSGRIYGETEEQLNQRKQRETYEILEYFLAVGNILVWIQSDDSFFQLRENSRTLS